MTRAAGILAAIGTVLACLPAAADDGAYIALPGEGLAQGRAVWLANCEGCHGYGIAGAPIPMKPAHWAPRLNKGKPVLYEHAINGFYGPDDTVMPERGTPHSATLKSCPPSIT